MAYGLLRVFLNVFDHYLGKIKYGYLTYVGSRYLSIWKIFSKKGFGMGTHQSICIVR